MAECRECGKRIKFVGEVGKLHPVDVTPLIAEYVEERTVLISEDGKPFRAGEGDYEYGYASHFSTCTNPARFRKSR